MSIKWSSLWHTMSLWYHTHTESGSKIDDGPGKIMLTKPTLIAHIVIDQRHKLQRFVNDLQLQGCDLNLSEKLIKLINCICCASHKSTISIFM